MLKPLTVCIVLISAVCTIICTERNVQAGEVILKFTATIDELNGDVSRIPVPLEVGDTITTEYIFDAALFDANHTGDLGSQRLSLGDLVLQSSNSAGLVLNFGSGAQFMVTHSTNIPTADTLMILCPPTNVVPGCNTNRFPDNANLHWDPLLWMIADDGSLQTLADVRSVSSLTSIGASGFLNIGISALNPSWERVLTIQATLTEFVAVPEPAALVLGILAASIAVARFRTGSQRGRTTAKYK